MADTLTITDNRTGKTYELPITGRRHPGHRPRKIKTGADDFGLMTYDPAFINTASCRSAITFIDGDKGILEYRGYPIEQLAEHSNYLETAYLLLFGELPDARRSYEEWRTRHHAAHDAAREHQEVHGRVPLRRPPDGHLPQHRRRAVHVLPRRQADLRRASRGACRPSG